MIFNRPLLFEVFVVERWMFYLLNQITDHRRVITLTKQADRGELTEAAWHEALAPLLVNIPHQQNNNGGLTITGLTDSHIKVDGSIINNAQAEINVSTFD